MTDNTGEKVRICPSCRMSISVLATKCRFCGETVGKPKEETRELTVSDLGGETIQHRAPSGSIIEALESFRIGDGDGEEPQGDDTQANDLEMPSLDKLGDDYMESTFGDTPAVSAMTRPKPVPPTVGERVTTVLKFVVPIVLLIVAVVKVPAYFKDRSDQEQSQQNVFRNNAPSILASGGAPLEALAAALEAMQHDDGPANSKILEDSLNAVVESVEELLNAIDWDIGKLREASGIATQAAEMYPNETTTQLKAEVDQENMDYRMLLTKIDGATGEVTFKMNDPSKPDQVAKKSDSDQTVEDGDLVAGRFRITNVMGRRSVKMVDEKRRSRSLVCSLGKSPR